MNNDDLPSAGTDPFAPPPLSQNSPRSGSCLNWGLILIGGLTSLCGCVMAYGATSIQLDAQEDWEGFSAFLLLCPLPIVIVGIIILTVGALPLVKKGQIDSGPTE